MEARFYVLASVFEIGGMNADVQPGADAEGFAGLGGEIFLGGCGEPRDVLVLSTRRLGRVRVSISKLTAAKIHKYWW